MLIGQNTGQDFFPKEITTFTAPPNITGQKRLWVDMYSTLATSCFIERKKPEEVIDKLMEKWIRFNEIFAK